MTSTPINHRQNKHELWGLLWQSPKLVFVLPVQLTTNTNTTTTTTTTTTAAVAAAAATITTITKGTSMTLNLD